mgnify:CR=1 FL=1
MRHVHAVRTQRFMDIPTVLAARSGVVLFNPGALSRVQGRGSYGVVMVENGAPRFEHRRV